MKRILLPVFGLLLAFSGLAQSKVIYEEITSMKLGESRRLKIQLPRDYEENVDKSYPIVLVLDANYLFEPVAGNVDYFSYWEDMPEAIVVGVMQGDKRYDDCHYDDTNFMPAETGADFFEFVGLELMPYIDSAFRTAKFVIAVGHDFTANYINYYLFKDPPLFNGYISLSPDLAPMLDDRLPQRIPNIQSKLFYYMATGTDDIKDLMEITEDLNKKLSPLKSETFSYYYDNFEGATHYSLVARAIPSAMEKIFSVYRPISKQEYKDVLLKTEMPIHQYLVDKYKTIEDLFGLTNPIRVNDYLATARASEKRKQWESLKEIAIMAKQQYPDTNLGDYYLGRYYEEVGEPKKAMRIFQGAFDKEEVDFITTDLMLDKADKIKEDFGY
ncbi:alpha/beta hydrolase-fold protein [Aureisphaera galaxeae]|uniref:alpha/beta hydrolase n=1 Tax=Aureisphaera galaxeae TaxID=1538023 RepID=UPI00234FD56F|nr:alpha/beta hydrolase-fold protein [Aureisphaera galaxeae]MDC8002668.1 alpha/beta hydrolase-fold protein [Aureisphaera galaxeae]